MTLEQQLADWNKVKKEYEKALSEKDKELRNLYLHNFWFGVKVYNDKYQTKFNHKEEPK
jgi:hypothetical protein